MSPMDATMARWAGTSSAFGPHTRQMRVQQGHPDSCALSYSVFLFMCCKSTQKKNHVLHYWWMDIQSKGGYELMERKVPSKEKKQGRWQISLQLSRNGKVSSVRGSASNTSSCRSLHLVNYSSVILQHVPDELVIRFSVETPDDHSMLSLWNGSLL